MKQKLFFLLMLFSLGNLDAQITKIKVFLSCRCNKEYIKQNTLFFDYVRDRTLSDIEVFVFDINNAGGEKITPLSLKEKMSSKAKKTKSVPIFPKTSPLMK